MSYQFEFCDLKVQYRNLEQEIDAAIKKVLNSSRFINGPELDELEKQIASYSQSRFCVGLASGTDALLVPLMTMGLEPGDEVITTPFTFIATAEVVSLLKAKPVFVDIDEKTYNIDVNRIEEKITKRTKAIIPVHLYGQMADMDRIMAVAEKHHLVVIEDAAQAIGAEYKGKKACSIGDFGSLSFFPAKNLGAYGDGGMAVTGHEEYFRKMKMIRNHGSAVRYEHSLIGLNGRLDTLQCAILLVKLKHLDQWIADRNRVAGRYTEGLKDLVTTPYVEKHNKHVFNQYTIRTEKRDGLISYLNNNGIPTAIHYPKPLHLQECYRDLGCKPGSLPAAEKAAREVMSLPMYPEMPDGIQDTIIRTVREFFKSK
ncbi:MAG: DegT/DnrJ/EryC1/StrS family aminotransferase [bacterium]|nr:DegT/DnrJ/EryC1/StrS family aminotransferase [bacterium]